MSVEQIQLFGGPRHGETMAIPSGHHDNLELTQIVVVNKCKGTRTSQYTRVYTISGAPLHEFEWDGFSSPFVPLETTSS